jgi:hypothetical protein
VIVTALPGDGRKSTTKSYAGAIALFLRWCARIGRAWPAGVEQLGSFMTWLRHAGPSVSGVEAGGRQGVWCRCCIRTPAGPWNPAHPARQPGHHADQTTKTTLSRTRQPTTRRSLKTYVNASPMTSPMTSSSPAKIPSTSPATPTVILAPVVGEVARLSPARTYCLNRADRAGTGGRGRDT